MVLEHGSVVSPKTATSLISSIWRHLINSEKTV